MEQGCLDADVAAAFAAGLLEDDELSRVEAHIDECAACRTLLSEAARALSRGSNLAPSAPPSSPATAEALVSGVVIGRYVVDAVIGSGAMGVVYSAHDPELGRRVALKAMRSRTLPGGHSAERMLRREAKAMAQLSHPNVVAVYDLLVKDDLMFVAMELVEGVTLRRWLRDQPRGWREIVGAFVKAGKGLAAAHDVGIVHRDFKPENVLCGSDGRVCVSDFGLSRLGIEVVPAATPAGAEPAASSHSVSAAVAGTPRYMAPEQRAGAPATAQSDQFSFCVALYEALYRRHPFATPSEGAHSDAARGPRARVPRGIRRCLLRGLRDDPGERFASMGDLLAVLTRRTDGSRRRVAVAVVCVAAVAVAGLAWRHARETALDPCRGTAKEVDGAWSDEPRQAVSRAFAATGTPYAAGVEPRVVAATDRYATQWAAARTQTCSAAARANPAAVPSDPRMLCLDQRLRELRAVVDELRSVATTEDATSAVIAVELLPAPETCANDSALRAYGTSRATPGDAQRTESIRADLARADALIYFHKHAQAASLAERARDAAQSAGDRTLIGQALLRCGYTHAGLGRADVAQRELYDAIAAADAVGDDVTRARAYAHLLFFVPKGKIDAAQAPILFEQGMAAAARMGGDVALEGHLHMNYGFGLWTQRKFPDAKDHLERAVDLLRRGGHRMPLTDALSELALVYGAQGDLDAAVRTFETALANARDVLGDEHPMVATALANMASVLLERQDFAGALDATRRAVAINEATRPERPGSFDALATEGETLLELGRPGEALDVLLRVTAAAPPGMVKGWNAQLASNLGRTYLALHRPADAIAPLERAIAGDPSPEYAADARFALARALTELHRDPRRAASLADEARDTLDAMGTLTPLQRALRAAVASWLADTASAPARP